jgi:hypothetical protein
MKDEDELDGTVSRVIRLSHSSLHALYNMATCRLTAVIRCRHSVCSFEFCTIIATTYGTLQGSEYDDNIQHWYCTEISPSSTVELDSTFTYYYLLALQIFISYDWNHLFAHNDLLILPSTPLPFDPYITLTLHYHMHTKLWSKRNPLTHQGKRPTSDGDALSTVRHQVPCGWCSWYHFFEHVTEKDLTENITSMHSLKAENGSVAPTVRTCVCVCVCALHSVLCVLRV